LNSTPPCPGTFCTPISMTMRRGAGLSLTMGEADFEPPRPNCRGTQDTADEELKTPHMTDLDGIALHEEGTPSGKTLPTRLTGRERRQIRAKATREARTTQEAHRGMVINKWREAVTMSGIAAGDHAGSLGHHLVWTGHPWASIHASHVMLVAGGLAFCKKCGKTSSTGGTLDEVCFGVLPNDNATRVCKNLLRGILPDARSYPRWPNGDLRHIRHRPCALVLRIRATSELRPAELSRAQAPKTRLRTNTAFILEKELAEARAEAAAAVQVKADFAASNTREARAARRRKKPQGQPASSSNTTFPLPTPE
jgi:hypothetical protein